MDRKLRGASTVGPHAAQPAPAVAPHDPPRSAVACRSAIGRPILFLALFLTGILSDRDLAAGDARSRETEAIVEKERIQRDFAIAPEIQRGLLPRHGISLAGFDIAGWNQPADETGGDYYDFVPLGDDQVAVAIADVTGHGIVAALVVAGDGGATVPSLLRQNGTAEPLEISILEGMSRQSPKRNTSGNAVGAAAFIAILEIGRSGRQPGEAGEPDAVHGATGMNV